MASGTDLLPLEPKVEYLVAVRYREPSYEQRHGARAEPYRWTFRVQARSEDDAAARAVSEFHAYARQSSVSWTREIVELRVERAPADTSDDG